MSQGGCVPVSCVPIQAPQYIGRLVFDGLAADAAQGRAIESASASAAIHLTALVLPEAKEGSLGKGLPGSGRSRR
jgi:hypothetical protein